MRDTPLSRKYAATVISNDDKLMMGRVQVRIDGLHEDTDDEDLPWAIPVNMSQGHGAIDVPSVGRRIVVQLQDRDGNELLYSGLLLDRGDPEPGTPDSGVQRIPTEFKETETKEKRYPHRKGFWDKYGNYAYRDQTDGTIKVATTTGITMIMDHNGNLIVDVAADTPNVHGVRYDDGKTKDPEGFDPSDLLGNATMQVVNNLRIKVLGNIIITAGGRIHIEATETVRIVGSEVYTN